ncbi:hypothetical protein J4E89_007223 [Alternaria sp. Ai002NY15]|nr:hypothetical protein J4E89_007223 [Alternaria sp. Ai002NY15]
MATGIEAAGLVLGAIPLILAGLQFYAEGISVTRKYWSYHEEVSTILNDLEAENTMCINSIDILLKGVVTSKEMAEFLNDPRSARWKDKEFDRKLRARLRTSYDSYMASINQMVIIAEKFKERLKLNDAGKPRFSEKNAFKEHYRRLKFSLKTSDYKELMERLRCANGVLDRLTNQTALIEAHTRDRQSVPNFGIINERADSFHSALKAGWNCPCSAHHTVSLRLEARIDAVSSEKDEDDDASMMRDPFHVLFHYDRDHATEQSELAVAWSWEEADVRVDPIQDNTARVQRAKGVRFEERNVQKAVQAALEARPNMQPIEDLCAAISELQKPQREVCFSLLASELAKQKYGVHIYPTKQMPLDTETWSVSSLHTSLNDTDFARRDRLKLAVTLASSVLQLHETPWLDQCWNKDSIFFVKRPGMIMYDQPFVSRDFNHATPPAETGMPPSMKCIIRNQPLYALGVALIELWYNKPLQELWKEQDGLFDTGVRQDDLMTEWRTANRLVDDLYNEAGGMYGDAVRRCIRCDFDRRASSLDDIEFQRDVYHGVVSQLKKNYECLF